jgi:hypothetical protein
MSLFKTLLHAVRSWRRRRGGGTKAPKRAGVALERLDHRQLLSVNFTGNVTTDFPASLQPGVVAINPDPANPPQIPLIPPPLLPIVKVSGFAITGLRVSYTPADDVLSIGIVQPDNQRDGRPVIAGDADNNGNSETVNPAITAMPGFQNFMDFPDLGGPETMGVFLNFNPANPNASDLIAGFSNDIPSLQKTYQVADAVVNPMFRVPAFGTFRPQNTGGFFLFNSEANPNFELSIKNFSQVYQEKTGKPLTPDSQISIGAFGGSDEGGISEAFFPPQGFTIRAASPTPAPPPPVCPPASPPILINPHQNRHVNTAHPETVKVVVFGSSGFPVAAIEPATVRLGGAAPTGELIRDVNRDGFPDAVFDFLGDQIHLPPGITQAEVTGETVTGQMFASSTGIFNRDLSFYTPAQIAEQQARKAARAVAAERFDGAAQAHAAGLGSGPVVSIPMRHRPTPTVRIPGVSRRAAHAAHAVNPGLAG